MASAISRVGTPSSPTAVSTDPVGACSIASPVEVGGIFDVDGRPAGCPVVYVAGTPLLRAWAISRGMKPWRSPSPCTDRGSMTRRTC